MTCMETMNRGLVTASMERQSYSWQSWIARLFWQMSAFVSVSI